MLQLCGDVSARGRAAAEAAPPQRGARGGLRACRPGRNCPSAGKQKPEGQAALWGQIISSFSPFRTKGVDAFTDLTFALVFCIFFFKFQAFSK